MRITKLEYQKKDKNRVNVYVDGEFVVGVDVNDILKLNLYKDKELSQEDTKNLVDQSKFGKLFNFALNFLSFRPRSEWEIRMRLKRKFGKDSGAVQNDVVNKLKQINQIDDEVFAKWFVEQRNTFRPKGKRAIAMELRRFGVKIKVENDISETELAKRALKKYHGEKVREKIARFLASRGFNWDTIESVVARLQKRE